MAKSNLEKGASVWEVVIIVVLSVVVLTGLAWWTKPWNYIWQWQDNRMTERAENLAAALSAYDEKWGKFPWNGATGNYTLAAAGVRPESAFAAVPAKYALSMGQPEVVNRDWLLNYLDLLNLSPEDRAYWEANDNVVVLKAVSDGSRVAVCFEPKSARSQGIAATACLTDDWQRRNTPYEVEGVDVCATTDGELPATKGLAAELNLTWPQGAKANWYCVSAFQGEVE